MPVGAAPRGGRGEGGCWVRIAMRKKEKRDKPAISHVWEQRCDGCASAFFFSWRVHTYLYQHPVVALGVEQLGPRDDLPDGVPDVFVRR